MRRGLERHLSAATEWNRVLECARSPHIEFVFSNTTEVGIVATETGARNASTAPATFPGKLTAFLVHLICRRASHERHAGYHFVVGWKTAPRRFVEAENVTTLQIKFLRAKETLRDNHALTVWPIETILIAAATVEHAHPVVEALWLRLAAEEVEIVLANEELWVVDLIGTGVIQLGGI
jgi:hypothetical protein